MQPLHLTFAGVCVCVLHVGGIVPKIFSVAFVGVEQLLSKFPVLISLLILWLERVGFCGLCLLARLLVSLATSLGYNGAKRKFREFTIMLFLGSQGP